MKAGSKKNKVKNIICVAALFFTLTSVIWTDTGIVVSPDFVKGKDSHVLFDNVIGSAGNTQNFAEDTLLLVGYVQKSPPSTNIDRYWSFFKFDVSEIPDNASMDSAIFRTSMQSFHTTINPYLILTVAVYEVLEDWDEYKISAKVLPKISATMFCAREFTRSDSAASFDITALVRKWRNNPGLNFGIALVPVGYRLAGTGSMTQILAVARFYSSDFLGDTNLTPNIIVNVTPDSAPPQTTIYYGPDRSHYALYTPVILKYRADKTNCVFSDKLDTEDWTIWFPTAERYYDSMTPGWHTFSVKSKDNWGNEDTSPDTVTFKVIDTRIRVIDATETSDIRFTYVNTEYDSSWTYVTQIVYRYMLTGNTANYSGADTSMVNNWSGWSTNNSALIEVTNNGAGLVFKVVSYNPVWGGDPTPAEYKIKGNESGITYVDIGAPPLVRDEDAGSGGAPVPAFPVPGYMRIMSPGNGTVVKDGKVVLKAESDESRIKSVQFQYKKDGEENWNDVAGSGNGSVEWDMSDLGPGTYNIRLSARDGDNKSVEDDNWISVRKPEYLEKYLSPGSPLTLKLKSAYGEARVNFPQDAVPESTEKIIVRRIKEDGIEGYETAEDIVVIKDADRAMEKKGKYLKVHDLNNTVWEFVLLNKKGNKVKSVFNKEVEISIPVPDDSRTDKQRLRMFILNEYTREWEQLPSRVKDGGVSYYSIHFSIYRLAEVKDAQALNDIFCYPNPVRAGQKCFIENLQKGTDNIKIYDITGENVRILSAQNGEIKDSSNGLLRAEWDGKTGAGGNVSAGTYIIAVADQGLLKTFRVCIIR